MIISTLEVILFIVGGGVLVSLGYSSFWSFSIRRVLYERIYRSRALWTGIFAAYSACEIFVIVYLPNVVGYFGVNVVWLILGSALLFILTAWISSTVKVVVALDPLNRNRMNWQQGKGLLWIFSTAIVAMNVPSALNLFGYLNIGSFAAVLNYAQSGLIIALFCYATIVLVAYQMSTYDRFLKAYVKSFFYLLIVLLLNIALTPVALAFGLYAGQFAITDSLYIVSAFFMYKMVKSLAPVSTIDTAFKPY